MARETGQMILDEELYEINILETLADVRMRQSQLLLRMSDYIRTSGMDDPHYKQMIESGKGLNRIYNKINLKDKQNG